MTRRTRRWRKRYRGPAVPVAPVTEGTSGWMAYVPRADCVTYGNGHAGHVALLGDSILDNEHYVGDQPDVTQRLFSMLGDRWTVSLLARDGATTDTLKYQAEHIPGGTTALIVSIGGNDANHNAGILYDQTLITMREALEELWCIGAMFARKYADAVTPLLALGVPVTVCTIYDCDFAPGDAEPVRAALSIFNDEILRFAFAHGLSVLDLRTVCTTPEDYHAVIEPSAVGGAKIAAAITARVGGSHGGRA